MAAIDATNMQSMAQVQNRYQYRRMDGSEQGMGNNPLNSVMQNLPSDARSAIRDQIASLTPEQRTAFKDNLAQLDLSSLNQDQLASTVQDMLNQFTTNNTSDTTSIADLTNTNSTFSLMV
jgi:hypothetical protein